MGVSATWNCNIKLEYATSYFWKVRAIGADSYSEWGMNAFTTETAPSELLPPPSTPLVIEPAPKVPTYVIGIVVGIGAILVIALLVFIVRTRSYSETGTVKAKRLPFPGSLWTSILPPWASTRRLAMVSPSPLPPVALVRDLSTR